MGKLKRTACVCLMLAALLCGVAFQAFATQVAQPVACNTATGEQYTVLTAAAMEAAAGQTVALLTDVTEDAWIPVPEGVTLDLNGKILTAPYLSSYGNVIDSSEANSGLLCVPAERIYIRRDNAQLPVGTAEGYRFIQNNRFNEIILADGRYAFDFRAEEAAHSLLLAGTETSGVTVRVEVSWTESDGIRYQFFDYNENFLQEFIGSYDATTGRYDRMFTLTLFGTEGLKNLTLRAQLVSALGVTASSAGLQMETPLPPAADVTTDANGQVTEDVTVSNSTATATVATGTQLEQGTTSVTLTTTELTEGDKNITIADGEQSRSMDVHVEGVAATNTVPVIVTMEAFAPKYMNEGNLKLYHVENGTPVEMTRVASVEEVDAHNEYYYDVITGDVVMALATFSEITVVNVPANPWNGSIKYDWYINAGGKNGTNYTIANADQLAGLSAIVGGMKKVTGRVDGKYTYSEEVIQDSFEEKTITLLANINLDDKEEDGKIFYPIGYWNNEGTYERLPVDKRVNPVSSGFYKFRGTFDGNGNTISNFYQNTWEMKGDHNWYNTTTEQYYRDGMGLFGIVYGGTVKNLTVRNFSSDGEIATTGVIAAYADFGATFENISMFNCNPRVYNIGNGGIVGCVGWYAQDTAADKVTFRNITVDNSNKISALWGSWDVPCGGIVGQYYHNSGQTGNPKNPGILFDNCHVAAQIDVNNDVCANYQYYQYRYAGMLIGTVREVTKDANGNTVPRTDGITATKCTVNYGTWNEYWYCELEANSPASYTHDFQFSRLERISSESDIKDSSGNWNRAGNFVIPPADGSNDEARAVCYHIVEKEDGTLVRHLHEDAGLEDIDINGNGKLDDWKEDRVCYFMPFKQLISGNDGYATYKLESFGTDENVKVANDTRASVKKFNSNFAAGTKGYYKSGETVSLGDLFSLAVDKSLIDQASLNVFVSPVNEGDTASCEFKCDVDYWNKGTLTIEATGPVKVTITDYYYCENTEIILNPMQEAVGMYRLVTDTDKIRSDSESGKNYKYVIVAEKDGVHYALGLDGAAQQVHVVGEYITDTENVPEWYLGNEGFLTFAVVDGENAGKLLTRSGEALTQVAENGGSWRMADAEVTDQAGNRIPGYIDLNAQIVNEDDIPAAIAYYVDKETGIGAFGVHGEDHADEDHVFTLRLYKYINCIHKYPDGTSAEITDNGQGATCYEAGYQPGTYCDVCGEWLTGHGVIPTYGHDWGEMADANGAPLVNAECRRENCGAVVRMINGELTVLLPWNKTDSLPTSGAYYLTDNVNITKGYNVGAAGLILDLNGKDVIRTYAGGSNARVYTLSQATDTPLVITDTSTKELEKQGSISLDIADGFEEAYKAINTGSKRGTVIASYCGQLVLEGGIIDGSKAKGTAFGEAAVFVDSGETFTMTGGTIIGGENTDNGSALYVCRNSDAKITGGIIYGGTAYAGAAIYAGGNVTVGGETVVIAGQATGTISGSVINATMGDSIYAGAYTEQTTNIIGSNLTIEDNATINGGIAVEDGLSFKVTGSPTIDKDMSIAEWNDYLTAYNTGDSTYGIVMPQRWTAKNRGMRLDITGLNTQIPVTAFIDFTTAFDTETAAEEAAELIKNERGGDWQLYVNKITEGNYVLSLGIVRCANGHHLNEEDWLDRTCDECDEQVVRWTHWDYVSQLPSASGNYVLAADVTINHPQYPTASPYIVSGGQTVRLDLNGKNIVRNVPSLTVGSNHYGNHRVFTVDKGAALTVTDLSGKNIDEQGIVSVKYQDGTYDRAVYGGLVGVAPGSETEYGGHFTLCGGVLNGSTVYCDGYIEKNNANDGTVSLYNYATFTMYGGKIIGMNQPWSGEGLNTAGENATFNTSGSALGIFGSSVATVKGGEIVGGQAYHGGAIANAGTLTITGGTITGGTAQYGGAIYCTSTSSSSGKLTITGGTITEGEEKTHGTNIYTTSDCRAEINIGGNAKIGGGVTVNGAASVTLSGTPTIDKDGTSASYSLHLMKLASVKLDAAGLLPGAKIVIDNTGIFTTPMEDKATAEAIRSCFTSTEEPVYVIAQAADSYVLSVGTAGSKCVNGETNCGNCGNTLYADEYYTTLTSDKTIACVHGVSDCKEENCTGNLVWQTWDKADELPSTTGNYRLTQPVTVSAQTDIAPGNKVVLDLNGNDVTRYIDDSQSGKDDQRVYVLAGDATGVKGAELIITDTSTEETGTVSVQYEKTEGHKAYGFGTMINVQNYAKLTVYGGTLDGSNIISTEETTNGAANAIIEANNYATVIINGGTLKGMQNKASNSGGSVIGGMTGSKIVINGGKLLAWTGENAYTANRGGAISTAGELTITGGEITGGQVAGSGGTIYCTGSLTISGGTITGGAAGANGGNVYAAGALTITGGTIYGGSAPKGSGGNVCATGTLTITGGTIYGGAAKDYGVNLYHENNNAGSIAKISGGNIDGGVTIRLVDMLELGAEAQIRDSLNENFNAVSDLRLEDVTVQVTGLEGSLVIPAKSSSTYKCDLTYTDGKITGITATYSESGVVKDTIVFPAQN